MTDWYDVSNLEQQVPARHRAPAWFEDQTAPDILAEIVNVQREYVRQGDPQRMWDLLLDAALRTSFSARGFICEIEWSDRGIPSLVTRSIAWGGDGSLHPDVGLLVSQVIATDEPVFINPVEDGALPSVGIDGFMGLPLVSADRLVAVIGVSSPAVPYDRRLAGLLQPLLSTCASIVEALQASASRDRAVSELRSTASFLDAVFETAAMGIVVIDEEGRLQKANPAAREVLGLPAGRLAPLPVTCLVDRTVAARVERFVLRAVARGVNRPLSNLVVPGRRLDGAPVLLEVSVSEMQVGVDRNLVIVFQNITERVEAQRSLAKAAEVLDSTPDLVAWGSTDGSIDYLNRAGRSMVGPRIAFSDLFPDSDLARFWGAVEQAVDHGSWSGELTLVGQGGNPIPTSMVVLHQASSEGSSIALLARDLTERHELDQIKDAFVSNVSHELRTPLTSILGYLELLEEGDDLTGSQRDLVAVIHRNGDRLLHLIGQILLVASLDRSESDRRIEAVNFDELVREVLATVEVGAIQKGIRLRWDVESGAVLQTDRGELLSALTNVIGNAVKFTPSGGEVAVTTARFGSDVCLDVTDTGIGIHPADLERVTQRFYRGGLARTNEVQGTGLGLAIVEAVVQRSGGRIEIESSVGKGTTVKLLLPLADRDE